MKKKRLFYWLADKRRPLLCMALAGLWWSCSDSSEGGGAPFDPEKPVVLNAFYPDSGKYQEQVILTGTNFGTDPGAISVYFNTASAAVIGAGGDKIYVQAPRLPGDTCVLSVVIGKDSVSYDQPFFYQESVTVTTIAGNGNGDGYQDGDLSSSILQPRYLCVDKENNIFVSVWNAAGTVYELARIDEEANELVTIKKDAACNIPCADPETGMITVPNETTVGSFYTLNPDELWAPRTREMVWTNTSDRPSDGYKHCMVVNPGDGYIYTQYYFGQIVKINPSTYEAEVIYMMEQGDCYGMTFNPLRPNILYLSLWDNAGVNANSICTIDVTDPKNSFQIICGNSAGGHRDGPLGVAEFDCPAQIYCDDDGNIYVADYNNSCIRRITPDDMVETVLGMPGTAGWQDGSKDEALFDHPRGIGISSDGSVYVADYGNCRVRKLSIN